MSDRKPNEVLVAPSALEQLLSEGGARVLSVQNGPSPEAEIIGVEWRYVNGVPLIVLVYSSDVPEPVLTYEHGLEQRLNELEAEVRRLPLALRQGVPGWPPRTGIFTTGLYGMGADDFPAIAAILRAAAEARGEEG